MYFRALIAAIACLGFTSKASAEWLTATVDGQFVIIPRAEGPVAILGCGDDGRKAVMMSLDGGASLFNSDLNKTFTFRAKRARIFVEDEQLFSEKMMWIPAWQVAQTNDTAAFRTIYNAAIEGKDVRFKMSGVGDVQLTVPPVDDTFRELAACVSG